MSDPEEFNIAAWIMDIIEGSGGMNQFEEREMVIWHVPERIAAANWAVRCLANPRCKGSAEVLAAILERRRKLGAPPVEVPT
jgi:hypothetical protein